MNLPHGARFLFSMNGFRITSLEELLEGESYVCASGKSQFSVLLFSLLLLSFYLFLLLFWLWLLLMLFFLVVFVVASDGVSIVGLVFVFVVIRG